MTIAGGGTGGHVFPAIAVADALKAAAPGLDVSFVGTEGGFEATAVPAAGYAFDVVPSGAVVGRGAGAVGGLWKMARGFFRAVSILNAKRPEAVIGVGGYASVPVALAAAFLRIPLYLQEQNSVPGRSNRFLARFADRVFVGFEAAAATFGAKAVVTGNPVRSRLVAQASEAHSPAPPPPLVVLALGGSQGARAINRLVVAMAREAKAKGTAVRFILQTGSLDFEDVEREVRAESLPVEPFRFSDDVGALFSSAHVAVMRAGALSVSEAAIFGMPCVLIPYPFAADGHQDKNAAAYEECGAGVRIAESDATAPGVLAALFALGADQVRHKAARTAALRFARPNAAAAVAAAILADCSGGARV